MDLTGKQLGQLHKALLHAFPSAMDLQQVIRYGLGENPSVIASGGDLSSMVFNLLQWAGARNKYPALLKAAWDANSEDTELNAVIRDLQKAHPTNAELKKLSGQLSPPPTGEESTGGLNDDLFAQVRAALIECGPFNSEGLLRAVFVTTPSLSAWKDQLPKADSPAARVDETMALLLDKRSATQKNALVLFMRALSSRTQPGDECHTRLAKLADVLEKALD